jgi:hypothetical protein
MMLHLSAALCKQTPSQDTGTRPCISINQSINQSDNQSITTNQSINQSQPINQSINHNQSQSINQLIKQSSFCQERRVQKLVLAFLCILTISTANFSSKIDST